jgi:hypothetical protein
MILLSLLFFSLNANAQRYFALIDDAGVVQNVIVAEPEFIQSQKLKKNWQWKETWLDGGARKNYAGKGQTYQADLDAFVDAKPHPSWTLDSSTAQWKAPVERPAKDAALQRWDEKTQTWDLDSTMKKYLEKTPGDGKPADGGKQ